MRKWIVGLMVMLLLCVGCADSNDRQVMIENFGFKVTYRDMSATRMIGISTKERFLAYDPETKYISLIKVNTFGNVTEIVTFDNIVFKSSEG